MKIVPIIFSGLALCISLYSLYRTKRNDDASRLHSAEQKRTTIRANIIQRKVAISSVLQTIDRLSYNVAISKHPSSATMIATVEQQREPLLRLLDGTQKLIESLDSLQVAIPTLAELESLVGQTEASLKDALAQAEDIRAHEQLVLQKISRWISHNES